MGRIFNAVLLAVMVTGAAITYTMKHNAEAIRDLDEAIRLNPNYGNAYINRSAARRASGDNAGAEADLAKARQVVGR